MDSTVLSDMATHLLDVAWERLAATEELIPTFVLVHRGGAMEVVGVPWATEAEKLILQETVGLLVAQAGDVEAFLHVADVYVGSDTSGVLPSEDPGATEAVIVFASCGDGTTLLYARPYGRDDHGGLHRRGADQEAEDVTPLAGLATICAGLVPSTPEEER